MRRPQSGQVLPEHPLRPQPSRRDDRHRDQPRPPDGLRRAQPRRQVLAIHETHMDPGTGRDDRPGLLKLADLFPGHAQGEIREQRAAGVCSHVVIASMRPRARSSGPTRAAPVTGLLMRVLIQTASHARPGARLSGQQPQVAPRWCSTRTPVTAWHHRTMQPPARLWRGLTLSSLSGRTRAGRRRRRGAGGGRRRRRLGVGRGSRRSWRAARPRLSLASRRARRLRGTR